MNAAARPGGGDDSQTGSRPTVPSVLFEVPAPARRRRAAADRAGEDRADEVVSVALDVQPPHLDRLFDYRVPPEMAGRVDFGSRVRIRFNGRLTDGFVVDRRRTPETPGPGASPERDGWRAAADLRPIIRVYESPPVLTPEVWVFVNEVAHRWAGTTHDVLRFALPPRRAQAEEGFDFTGAGQEDLLDSAFVGFRPRLWLSAEFDGAGPALVSALREGQRVRGAFVVPPGAGTATWPLALAELAAVVAQRREQVLLLVPDNRTLDAVCRELDRLLAPAGQASGDAPYARWSAAQPATERYREFLRILNGQARIVVGLRHAVFAPLPQVRAVIVWDDGDDSYQERAAPYFHAREAAVLRASLADASLVVVSPSRSAEVQRWVEKGLLRELSPDPRVLRRNAPRIRVVDNRAGGVAGVEASRVPPAVFAVMRRALASGPVLVQVARNGYQPALACGGCGHPARCARCAGPLRSEDAGPPGCLWCGHPGTGWSCGQCGHRSLRSTVAGSRRTAQELGRAFPGVPVVVSSGEHIVAEVGGAPALVVATPGAEPQAPGGYAAGVLLDGNMMVGLDSLRAPEQTLRRWIRALSLVRAAAAGGEAVVVAADGHLTQSLVRWDPVGWARRDLRERLPLKLPPWVRTAVVEGQRASVQAVRDALAARGVKDADVFGPFPSPRSASAWNPPTWNARHAAGGPRAGADAPPSAQGMLEVPDSTYRMVVKFSYSGGASLVDALGSAVRGLSMRRARLPRVVVDALDD